MKWFKRRPKFGASYNLFNGEEHFTHSLRSIRSSVEYVNVVVQYVSNFGETAGEGLRHIVSEAARRGLVDEVIEFHPDLSETGQTNELAKRTLGLAAAKRARVTHFATMDADEYYSPTGLELAKSTIIQNNLATTAAHTYLHIKRPIWRSKEPDDTCVAFFTRIGAESQIDYAGLYPAHVDPTRRLHGDRPFFMFSPDIISMKHMNLVRLDGLGSKLRNTSSRHMTDFIESVRGAYDEWEYGKVLYFPGKPPMEIIQVADEFDIDQMYSGVASRAS